jgi:transcriptional regulator of acetoin/glycerol metabolism
LTPAAEEALLRHGWPGNVRELQNVVRRAALLADGDRILPEHLGLARGEARVPAAAEPDPREIKSMLEACEGNVSQAARRLGMSRQALYRRMEKLGNE